MPENAESIYRDMMRDTIKEFKEVIRDMQKEMNQELKSIHASIAVLQYKSGVWGAIGALTTILGFLLLDKLKAR